MKVTQPLLLTAIVLMLSQSHISAQKTDTLFRNQKTYFKPKALIIPSALIITGLAINGNGEESVKMELREERNEHLQTFRTRADDFLQFSPIAIAYGLDAVGIKSKNDWANRTAILIKGEAVMLGVTFGGKKLFHQLRPDGSDYSSFPSGHTAQAFAAATFLSEEYKDRFKWMPYVAYSIAAGVGGLRIANNKHYLSDVLAGAGLGILSMKLSYWTHQYKWNNRKKQIVML